MTDEADEATVTSRFGSAAYRQRSSFILGEFLSAWLVRLHRHFRGDLISALILGEIAHSNLRGIRALTANGHGTRPAPERLYDDQGEFDLSLLRPCNALSISASTGVPRETVRRKLRALVNQGLVRRIARNKLILDPRTVASFMELDRQLIEQFLSTAHRLDRLARHFPPGSRADAPAPVEEP